ncbi:MAG: SEC-C domain-containing protein [Gammaproteobacteria bacterium]|nr:SEC-C domain-containing protein [Gammaproteobacteria bacterium]
MNCPCGSGRAFDTCCGRLLAGASAPTAEALMRSRYTACTRGDHPYLLATWHPSTRPAAIEDLPAGSKWLGLEVRRAHEHGARATVEFIARSKLAGRASRLHETSRFVREDGRWWYVDGEVRG